MQLVHVKMFVNEKSPQCLRNFSSQEKLFYRKTIFVHIVSSVIANMCKQIWCQSIVFWQACRLNHWNAKSLSQRCMAWCTFMLSDRCDVWQYHLIAIFGFIAWTLSKMSFWLFSAKSRFLKNMRCVLKFRLNFFQLCCISF